jgi:hypothetical protein
VFSTASVHDPCVRLCARDVLLTGMGGLGQLQPLWSRDVVIGYTCTDMYSDVTWHVDVRWPAWMRTDRIPYAYACRVRVPYSI